MQIKTQDEIKNQIKIVTKRFDKSDLSHYTTSAISSKLSISRSLASQYLNQLVKENVVVKINSRPVYFFHKRELELIYNVTLDMNEYDSFEEMMVLLEDNKKTIAQQIIGLDGSLNEVYSQLYMGMTYPAQGLPILFYGETGTGKNYLLELLIRKVKEDEKLFKHLNIIHFHLTEENVHSITAKIFGVDSEKMNTKSILEKSDNDLLIISGFEKKSPLLEDKVINLIETQTYTSIGSNVAKKAIRPRLVFVAHTKTPKIFSDRFINKIPIVVKMPTYQDRYLEEKEQLILTFLRKESRRINKKIKINNNIFTALVDMNFDDNLLGLEKTIQKICANELVKQKDTQILFIKNQPDIFLPYIGLDLHEQENTYIDIFNFSRSEEVEKLQNYFDEIIDIYYQDKLSGQAQFDAANDRFKQLTDYLIYKNNYSNRYLKNLELNISNIIDSILMMQHINLPANFSFIIARIYYLFEQYDSSFNEWSKKKEKQLSQTVKILEKLNVQENYIKENIKRILDEKLELKMNRMLEVIIVITLKQYNQALKKKDQIGLIICHGYATASSIADAANNLLSSYLFDAIDMPLAISSEEIGDRVSQHINRMNVNCDVIILVDMGSLESIGERLDVNTNRTIAVINNVSTKMALFVGSKMQQSIEIETIVSQVKEDLVVEYKLFNQLEKSDAIIFVSESGVHIAQRLLEMFEQSVPTRMDVNLLVIDYFELLRDGKRHYIFDKYNILFISGTSNPNINQALYIGIEGVIASNDIETIGFGLSKHLNRKQLEATMNNLRKMFSLQNVVRYITILNPVILLDNVENAVTVLEKNLNVKLNGKTIIGLHVHISCLVERLVTKNTIPNQKDLTEFKNTKQRFIHIVNDSFKELTHYYNVTIPIDEVAYLYEYISEDGKMTNDELMYDWID